jgi:hypothetical protein
MGESFILIIHEALYFGSSLDHSLVNPNQLRAHGLIVHDNPYKPDPERSMGIMITDHKKLPFRSDGSTIYFTTWFPSEEELDTFQHVVLTSDLPWDPHALIMPYGDHAEQGSNNDRFIQRMTSDIALNSNRDHERYESDIIAYSFMGNTEQLFCERMIQSVRVNERRNILELQSTTQHSQFTPEHVAKIFGVGFGTAQNILATTTQKGIRHSVMPLNRRYRVDHIHLNLRHLAGTWTMDHLESKYMSIRQHTGAIVFTDGNLVMVYPTKTKNDDDCTESLRRMTDDVGIPANLKSDMAATFVGHNTDFQTLVRKLQINMMHSEPYRHNQLQSVDVAMRELKRKWRYKMQKRNVPRRLWCFGLEHQARLMNFIPRGRNERTGYEIVTGRTPDISEYLDFDFYDLVWYWRTAHPSLSEHDRELARWMGVAHRVGSDMCYWLMPVSGVPVVNTTVQHVTSEDLRNVDIQAQVDDFNTRLHQRLEDTNFVLPGNDIDYYPTDQYTIDLENGDPENGDADDEGQPEADTIDDYDTLVGATFLLDAT